MGVIIPIFGPKLILKETDGTWSKIGSKEGIGMKRLSVLVLLIFLTLAGVKAQDKDALSTPLTKKVDGYYVSIGVVEIAQLKDSFPRAYRLLVKHHGKPAASDTHHVAVSIWRQEGKEFRYLSDFDVEAEVRSQLMRAERKKLGRYPHQYGDNYGAWFNMSDKGLYHISVIIKDGGREKKVDFDYLIQ